jgi:hypothetical protein
MHWLKTALQAEVEDKGKEDIYPSFFTPIHLEVGLGWCRAYIMACFKQV